IVEMTAPGAPLQFLAKNTYPIRRFSTSDRVRIVPGGSSIRDGAYTAAGVVCMPPMFVNAGAYIDEGTMIDSHALVGSCAQIGKRVHISAAAQIGGVLEPAGAMPVVIEDDCIVGGNCGVYEGAIVRKRAVLASGTIITGSTPLFDLVREEIYRRSADSPLEIPAGAVVVPGSRAIQEEKSGYTLQAGIPGLREKIAGDYPHMNLNLDQIIVTAGSQEALYLIMRTLVEEGDEVLLPNPGFIPYTMMTRMLGGRAVTYRLPAKDDFGFDLDDFKSKLSERTKVVICISPSNPTGRVLTKDDLRGIAKAVEDSGSNAFIINDEIYRELYYTAERPPS